MSVTPFLFHHLKLPQMKYTLLLLAQLSFFASFGQVEDTPTAQDIFRLKTQINNIGTSNQAAGRELMMFKKKYYLGVSLQAVGVALAGIAVLSNTSNYSGPSTNNTATTVLFFSAGACGVIGGTISLFSHRHVGIAGELMKRDY